MAQNSSWAASLGNALGTGLGQGLNQLAQHKLKEMHRQKITDRLSKIGYSPEQSDLLSTLQQESPEHFHQILSMANPAKSSDQQALFASPKTQAQDLKIEAHKDKLRPELKYLDELEMTAKELKSLLENKQDPVEFGVKSAALSHIPIIGTQLLGGNTGTFDALSNKFHTDAAQNAKGVRSVYHVKILGASKPSLSKTKEQNEKILNYWQKYIDKKRSDFLKAHPEFLSEVESNQQQPAVAASQPVQQQMQQVSQPRFRKNAQGKVQEWDPVSQEYKSL